MSPIRCTTTGGHLPGSRPSGRPGRQGEGLLSLRAERPRMSSVVPNPMPAAATSSASAMARPVRSFGFGPSRLARGADDRDVTDGLVAGGVVATAEAEPTADGAGATAAGVDSAIGAVVGAGLADVGAGVGCGRAEVRDGLGRADVGAGAGAADVGFGRGDGDGGGAACTVTVPVIRSGWTRQK